MPGPSEIKKTPPGPPERLGDSESGGKPKEETKVASESGGGAGGRNFLGVLLGIAAIILGIAAIIASIAIGYYGPLASRIEEVRNEERQERVKLSDAVESLKVEEKRDKKSIAYYQEFILEAFYRDCKPPAQINRNQKSCDYGDERPPIRFNYIQFPDNP